MATAVSYEGRYYPGNSSISFRSLQQNFGGNSNNVKFSTYYRNTDVENTDPIVPDATENANIATSGAIEASDFRNSIKKYYITQTGGEQNYDIDAQTWNSNLGKNVLKEARLNGTLSASSTGNNAAHFNSGAFNLKIVVSGGVYGHEGLGANPYSNGGNAGPAMFVNNSTGRTGSSSSVLVRVNAGGIVAGGGGGGGGGGSGNGGSVSCYNEWGYNAGTRSNSHGQVYSQGCIGCQGTSTSPEGFGGSLHANNCFGNFGRARCRGSKKGPQGTRGEACNSDWTQVCVYRRYVTVSSGGGTGGNGGHGQGANRLSEPQSGGGGNPGGRSYCAANNQRAQGNSGGSGGRGGYFGENGSGGSGNGAGNGGSAGAAIYRSGGRPYNVEGTSYIRGNY